MRIVDPMSGKSYVEKRRVRYNEPGQPRELTFSCYRHYAFLGRERTRAWFCEALDEARTRFAFQLWAYVVMPNYWHFVLWPEHDGDLSNFCRWLAHTHSMRWHAHYHTSGTGHIYQGRFKA